MNRKEHDEGRIMQITKAKVKAVLEHLKAKRYISDGLHSRIWNDYKHDQASGGGE